MALANHLVLIVNLDDDGRRVGLDVLASTVNKDLAKDQKFVPCRRKRFVDHLKKELNRQFGSFFANLVLRRKGA